ncbi:hypothetical protein ACWDRB_53415 [Nonomuraea sp. NPDC003707]
MWTLGTIFAIAGVIDVGFIAVQAARGTYSHFNAGTDPFDQIGQQIFSGGVFGLFGTSVIVAVMLLFQRVGDAVLTWSLRAGLGLAVAGMALASFITGWTSSAGPRTVEDAYGRPVPLVGGHGVGAPDGDGMPITNWSTTGGDLRVPHFIGLHSIQVFVLTARWQPPSPRCWRFWSSRRPVAASRPFAPKRHAAANTSAGAGRRAAMSAHTAAGWRTRARSRS